MLNVCVCLAEGWLVLAMSNQLKKIKEKIIFHRPPPAPFFHLSPLLLSSPGEIKDKGRRLRMIYLDRLRRQDHFCRRFMGWLPAFCPLLVSVW